MAFELGDEWTELGDEREASFLRELARHAEVNQRTALVVQVGAAGDDEEAAKEGRAFAGRSSKSRRHAEISRCSSRS